MLSSTISFLKSSPSATKLLPSIIALHHCPVLLLSSMALHRCPASLPYSAGRVSSTAQEKASPVPAAGVFCFHVLTNIYLSHLGRLEICSSAKEEKLSAQTQLVAGWKQGERTSSVFLSQGRFSDITIFLFGCPCRAGNLTSAGPRSSGARCSARSLLPPPGQRRVQAQSRVFGRDWDGHPAGQAVLACSCSLFGTFGVHDDVLVSAEALHGRFSKSLDRLRAHFLGKPCSS